MTAVLRAKQGLPQRRDWNLPEGLEAFGTAALRAELGVANGPDPGA